MKMIVIVKLKSCSVMHTFDEPWDLSPAFDTTKRSATPGSTGDLEDTSALELNFSYKPRPHQLESRNHRKAGQ
jgi:hypothetical protein